MNNDTLRNYQYLPIITTYYSAIATYSIALISAESNSEPETKGNATMISHHVAIAPALHFSWRYFTMNSGYTKSSSKTMNSR